MKINYVVHESEARSPWRRRCGCQDNAEGCRPQHPEGVLYGRYTPSGCPPSSPPLHTDSETEKFRIKKAFIMLHSVVWNLQHIQFKENTLVSMCESYWELYYNKTAPWGSLFKGIQSANTNPSWSNTALLGQDDAPRILKEKISVSRSTTTSLTKLKEQSMTQMLTKKIPKHIYFKHLKQSYTIMVQWLG